MHLILVFEMRMQFTYGVWKELHLLVQNTVILTFGCSLLNLLHKMMQRNN